MTFRLLLLATFGITAYFLIKFIEAYLIISGYFMIGIAFLILVMYICWRKA